MTPSVQYPNISTTLAGAQNIDLRVSDSIQFAAAPGGAPAALTGDTVLTFVNTPDTQTPKQTQKFSVLYSPATHHLTTSPAAADAATLAAINTAEGTAAYIILNFYCATDGRIILMSWGQF